MSDKPTGIPGAEEMELNAAQWQIEREEPKAVMQQLAEGEKEADKANEYRDKQDPDYNPNNPAEEKME